MPKPISDLALLLRTLDPELHEGVYAFSSVPLDTNLSQIDVIGTFREFEGLTVILSETEALRVGLPVLFRAAWITLTVNSAFEAIGLTAAFSTALGNAGISCNVVAGSCHDHIFVPVDRANDALDVIRDLQSRN